MVFIMRLYDITPVKSVNTEPRLFRLSTEFNRLSLDVHKSSEW